LVVVEIIWWSTLGTIAIGIYGMKIQTCEEVHLDYGFTKMEFGYMLVWVMVSFKI
jgi:hypothetical protein